jgi:hypothetical protein
MSSARPSTRCKAPIRFVVIALRRADFEVCALQKNLGGGGPENRIGEPFDERVCAAAMPAPATAPACISPHRAHFAIPSSCPNQNEFEPPVSLSCARSAPLRLRSQDQLRSPVQVICEVSPQTGAQRLCDSSALQRSPRNNRQQVRALSSRRPLKIALREKNSNA